MLLFLLGGEGPFCYFSPYGESLSPCRGLFCYVFPHMRGLFHHAILLRFSPYVGFSATFSLCGCFFSYYRGPFWGFPPLLVLVLVYTQEGSLWSIVLRCDDHTGIFTCDGCARDPYFYVPAESTQSYVIKLS